MGSYDGAENALVEAWLKVQLATKATELDAESSGLANRIFNDVAPNKTPYPFIVYQCQSPPRDIRGVGTVRVMIDTLYVVKAVAETSDYDTLAPIAHIIDQAMTSAEGSAVGDGAVFSSVRDRGFAMAEPDSGNQIRNLGGVYRIHAQG